MLLTITTTHQPATDLGYLLHKHPDKVQEFKLSSYGKVQVFYPESTTEKCTAAFLLDINPLTLSRGNKDRNNTFPLQPYVNDRPYVASSFMSHAFSRILSSALNGTCADKPKLVQQAIPLSMTLSAIAVRGGTKAIDQLFKPLGYTIEATGHDLDEVFTSWGKSRYYTLTLTNTITLSTFLRHLYLLIPVLDGDKHYWVGDMEVEKLLEKGEGWLAQHPAKELITRRYLKYQRSLSQKALQQLAITPSEDQSEKDAQELTLEKKITNVKGKPLNQQRMDAVFGQLVKSGANKVLDLGCGSGVLIRRLMQKSQFSTILGMDVSYNSLIVGKDRLKLDRLPDHLQDRVQLIQGSLMYADERLKGFDAAALVEVIEHIEPARLEVVERVIFEVAQPKTVIITTPNQEYNQLFATLPHGKMRHSDHRFEWTRQQFQAWAFQVCSKFGYGVTFHGIGPKDKNHGTPSQMAIFTISDKY